MLGKIGPHSRESPPPNTTRWAVAAPIVKEIGRTSLLRIAPPGATTIYRRFFRTQDLSRNGAVVAQEVVNSLGGFKPTYVELYNETAQYLGEGLERHVEFTWEASTALHAWGYKLAGFCFSVGVPNEPEWIYLQRQGFGGADVIAIHEYWGNQGFTPWTSLRHRTVHAWLQGEHPPFVITECGRDAVDGGGAGWKLSGISAQQYVDEVKRYDALLREDSYVLGGNLFTSNGAPDYWAFEVEELVLALNDWVPVPPLLPEGGRLPLALVAGVALGAIGVALIAREARAEKEELLYPRPELVFYDIREIEEGEPVPPGYIIIMA